METQTRLSRHNQCISAENITILSFSSDDYLHASSYSEDRIKELENKKIKIRK